MWSTVTLTPTFFPHSCTNGSNHLSCAGTKWLHSRILRSPESLRVGSVNVADGAGTSGATVGGADCSPDTQPATAAPITVAPATCKNRRRDRPYGSMTEWLLIETVQKIRLPGRPRRKHPLGRASLRVAHAKQRERPHRATQPVRPPDRGDAQRLSVTSSRSIASGMDSRKHEPTHLAGFLREVELQILCRDLPDTTQSGFFRPSTPRRCTWLRRNQPGCRTSRGHLPMPGSRSTTAISPQPVGRAAHQRPQPDAAGVRTLTAPCRSDAVVERTTFSWIDQNSRGRGMQTTVLRLSLAASAREERADGSDHHKARNSGSRSSRCCSAESGSSFHRHTQERTRGNRHRLRRA